MDLRLSEKSRVNLRLNLNAGVTIPSGSVVSSTAGVKFSLINSVSNNGSIAGDIFAPAQAVEFGPKTAEAGTITQIAVPITGWNSVINDDSAILPNDIDFSSGDLVITSGINEVRQNIQIRLKFFKGEWFLNSQIGIPYYGTILTKNPNLSSVRSILREAIEDIPKVKEVTLLETEITTGSRELKVRIEVLTDLDEILAFDDVLIF